MGLRRERVSPSPHLPKKEAKAPLGSKENRRRGAGLRER